MSRTRPAAESTYCGGDRRHGRYALLDFGDGRKLESLAGYLIDRPSPAAARTERSTPRRWAAADARFDASRKRWIFRRPFPKSLRIDCQWFSMPVHPTPFGHVGVFPEQAANWKWLHERAADLARAPRAAAGPCAVAGKAAAGVVDAAMSGSTVRALNLFGYTGASSLALAAAGSAVAHVDAAKPNVEAAKTAAKCSDLSEAPIRFLVDDARKFVQRELRRRNRYQIVALDPPAYGHGPRGKAWRLERDVWPLLEGCLTLLEVRRANGGEGNGSGAKHLLFTGHSESVGPETVLDWLRSNSDRSLCSESGRAELRDARGRRLDAGFYIRATWG